ncbi:hypothetical protein BTI679_31220 [Bacillus wiedmannii]|nr:hypothetical protein [Bacillus wiedmannii]UOB95778.1 hypothetical protein BTI679_31220 [Bacillus wiedmannii]
MALAVLRIGHLTILTDLLVVLAGHILAHTEALPTLVDQEAGTNEEITCSGWSDSTPHRLRF